MKNILVTGENSYIGTSFKNWVLQYHNKYSVNMISLRDNKWSNLSFSKYDAIYHTAAVVHSKQKDPLIYSLVNRDLTIKVAEKAKKDGVKQFVFLSTMGVYGVESGVITKDTNPNPRTPYAKSKLEAEKLLLNLSDESFKVTILRPPIVYGKACPGNYTRLARISLLSPFFPDLNNERSMIYVDNLSEFVRLTIEKELSGIYFPQNESFVNISDLIIQIRRAHGKKLYKTKLFNWLNPLGLKISKNYRKIFSTLIYEKDIPGSPLDTVNKMNYQTVSFKESIFKTEK